MFSWFHHSDPEEPSKEAEFPLSWYKKGGPPIASQGTSVSATGVVFTTTFPPPEKDFNVEFELRERPLHARVHSKRPQLVTTPTGLQHQYACRFVGISADDWDAVVRYVNEIPEVAHEGPFYDPERPDDEFRSLPTLAQRKIIEDLAKKERLEMPPPGVAPLIRMTSQGEARTKEGLTIKKFVIHSRLVALGEDVPKEFDTKYSIDAHNNVVCLTEPAKK